MRLVCWGKISIPRWCRVPTLVPQLEGGWACLEVLGPGAPLQGPRHTAMPRRGCRGHRGLIRRLAAPKLRICAVMKTKGRLGWCGGRAGAEGGLVRTAGRCDRLDEVSGQARRGRSAGRGRDWGAAGRRYTRLMTSKADHHRPLPHRHSPFNPLSFIFKSPSCPSCPFSPPTSVPWLPPTVVVFFLVGRRRRRVTRLGGNYAHKTIPSARPFKFCPFCLILCAPVRSWDRTI